jgi:hypothetical protein
MSDDVTAAATNAAPMCHPFTHPPALSFVFVVSFVVHDDLRRAMFTSLHWYITSTNFW